MFFGRRPIPRVQKETYDRDTQIPVLRSSICTGEKVAGFRDTQTGTFTDVMLIRDDRDLDVFLATYSISETELRKEW